MIKIINGKRYNTETAHCVATYGNGETGHSYFYEELYITRKGSWFLSGSGGAFTPYGESSRNQMYGTSAIKPFTKEEAYEWCERHDKSDVIEEYFADMIEEA